MLMRGRLNLLYSERKILAGIPVIELALEALRSKPAPLLFFYHGWTASKEEVLGFGKVLARKGFRLVLPDCSRHGERATESLKMWQAHQVFLTVLETAAEFPTLLKHYQESGLIDKDFVAVAGVSMGGLVTNAILCNNPEVQAAGSLMGTACLTAYADWVALGGIDNLVEASSIFYPDLKLPDERILEGVLRRESDRILTLKTDLAGVDLSLKPQNLNYRPTYFWQSREDPLMPVSLNIDFADHLKGIAEGKNFELDLSDQGGHLVPLAKVKKLLGFLWQAFVESGD